MARARWRLGRSGFDCRGAAPVGQRCPVFSVKRRFTKAEYRTTHYPLNNVSLIFNKIGSGMRRGRSEKSDDPHDHRAFLTLARARQKQSVERHSSCLARSTQMLRLVQYHRALDMLQQQRAVQDRSPDTVPQDDGDLETPETDQSPDNQETRLQLQEAILRMRNAVRQMEGCIKATSSLCDIASRVDGNPWETQPPPLPASSSCPQAPPASESESWEDFEDHTGVHGWLPCHRTLTQRKSAASEAFNVRMRVLLLPCLAMWESTRSAALAIDHLYTYSCVHPGRDPGPGAAKGRSETRKPCRTAEGGSATGAKGGRQATGGAGGGTGGSAPAGKRMQWSIGFIRFFKSPAC